MSTYASPLSSGKTSPQGALRILGKLFTSSGVIGDSLAVTAQDTPDMSVLVAGSATDDIAVLIHSDGHFIQAWNDADDSVTIDANNSGVTKTDAIVAYVDLTAGDSTNANNPGALSFVAVRRSGTDTGEPTTAEIETAVSSNPYLVLAYVTVANGVASINSGNISDQRTTAQIAKDNLEPIGTNQIASEAWTSYSMAWTALGDDPSIGNGTISAKYQKIGRMVTVLFAITMGSTTTYGTSAWLVSVPFPAVASGRGNGHAYAGCADSLPSVGGSGVGTGYLFSTTEIVFDNASSRGNINSTTPFAWGSDDVLYGTIVYEAAE